MKTIKNTLLTRPVWVFLISAIIALASLTCFSAFAQRRHSSAPSSKQPGIRAFSNGSDSDRAPYFEEEKDPDLIRMRNEWRRRFIGNPGAPGDYTKGLSEVSTLPLSPLVQNWVFQALSPMWNDWGNTGYPCQTPLPPDSPCGSGGRIWAIAVDPTNADTVYVGSEGGGIAKSTDAGAHWSYLSNGLSSQSIRSLAIDPISNNIVYAGTGTLERFGVGIYRSINSGGTWTNVGSSQFSGKTVCKIAVDPPTAGSTRTTTLYASVIDVIGGGIHSVWKSTNSGTNWTQLPRTASGARSGSFYDIAINPDEARLGGGVYVTAPDGLFRSTDGGTSWSSSIHPRGTPPDPGAPSCLARDSHYLYIAFPENGHVTIAKSALGIGSWNELPPPCVPMPPPDPPYCAALYTFPSFGVNPARPNQIFVGGGGDLVYSLDGGANWLRAHDVHVDNDSIAFCPNNPQRIYLGTDGGMYRADYTSGSEIRWWSKNENFPSSLMYGLSISRDDHIVQGNQDNGTQLGWAGRNPPWGSIYGGDGWKPKIEQTMSDGCDRLYYVYYGSVVNSDSRAPMRVVMCGATRTDTNITPTGAYGEQMSFFPAMFVAPTDWNRVVMGFQKIWRSTDGGQTSPHWTRIGGTGCVDSACATFTSVYEAPTDTNVIYAVAGNSRVWVTSNANQGNSATWTNRTSNLPPADGTGGILAVTIDPSNSQIAYIGHTRANTGLYKTTNGGISWTQLGFGTLGCWDVAIDPANTSHVFAATSAGVYASTDGGTTWASTAGIPAGMEVTSLSLNAITRHLAASTYGRGAYILDLGELRQAEAGVLTGCYIQADPNASGGYRVDGISSPGDNVAFNNFTQTTQITIRYASPYTGTFGLYVNGTRVASIPITATGPYPQGWTIFAEKVVNVTIPANATVKFQYDTGDVGINLDYVMIAR